MANRDSFRKLKFYQRQWIVNNDVQWAIINYSILLSMAVLSGSRLLESFEEGQTFLVSDPLTSKVILLTLVFLLFIFMILYGMYLTNRIAGPLYRLKEQLENLNEGKPVEPLVFRKSDFFKEFADLFNKILKKMPGPKK